MMQYLVRAIRFILIKLTFFIYRLKYGRNLVGQCYSAQSKNYRICRSGPSGQYTLYIGDRAIATMNEVGLSVEEIEVLSARVFAKCQELEVGHNEPVHFIFDVQEVSREPSWTVTKIVPPMELEQGKPIARSIVVFLPNLRAEIETTKSEVEQCAAVMEVVGKHKKANELRAALPMILKTKYKTILTHEMVHVFATDEYREWMPILGLGLLELLTDSINLVTFYSDYKNKKIVEFEKMGIAEGIGYLSNLLRAEHPNRPFGPEIVDLAYARAKEIIKECKKKKSQHAQMILAKASRVTQNAASKAAAVDFSLQIKPGNIKGSPV